MVGYQRHRHTVFPDAQIRAYGIVVPVVPQKYGSAHDAVGTAHIFQLIRKIFDWLRDTRFFGPKIEWLEQRAHLKGRVVRKYRLPGLIILVGIPLPGTGAWTGTMAASFLNMGFKSTTASVSLGVIIAGIIMGLASMGVFGVLGF